eukprot:1879337-Pyramimonas_sp.AAC.1
MIPTIVRRARYGWAVASPGKYPLCARGDAFNRAPTAAASTHSIASAEAHPTAKPKADALPGTSWQRPR